MFASIHFNENQSASSEVLLSCAKSFSPFVELTDDRTVVFSIDGLNAFYPTPQKIAHAIAEMASSQGHHPNIAIASNADAALLAARNFTGVTVLTDATRLSALDQLHVESLRLPDEASEMLEDWGIETLKEISDLPTADLAVRLGKEGLKLQKVARGEMRRPLMVTRSEPLYEKRIDLDFTVDLIEPLLFGLSGPLSEACELLGSEGRAISDLSARFGLHDRTSYLLALKFPVPIVKSKTLLHLLRMELEARPPGGAVVSIDLRIGGATPRRTQGGLFLPQSPEPEKLELTLARLRGLVGDDKLGVPFIIDTYRPDAFLLRAASFPTPSKSAQKSEASAQPLRLALRRFRPPLKATVLLHAGRPSGIRASDRQGKVQIASGPWRGSGEWWSEDEWSREEWDVELEEGSVYRIFRDPTDAWFIDGVYD